MEVLDKARLWLKSRESDGNESGDRAKLWRKAGCSPLRGRRSEVKPASLAQAGAVPEARQHHREDNQPNDEAKNQCDHRSIIAHFSESALGGRTTASSAIV